MYISFAPDLAVRSGDAAQAPDSAASQPRFGDDAAQVADDALALGRVVGVRDEGDLVHQSRGREALNLLARLGRCARHGELLYQAVGHDLAVARARDHVLVVLVLLADAAHDFHVLWSQLDGQVALQHPRHVRLDRRPCGGAVVLDRARSPAHYAEALGGQVAAHRGRAGLQLAPRRLQEPGIGPDQDDGAVRDLAG